MAENINSRCTGAIMKRDLTNEFVEQEVYGAYSGVCRFAGEHCEKYKLEYDRIMKRVRLRVKNTPINWKPGRCPVNAKKPT